MRSLKVFDANFVYRAINISEVVAHGGRNVHILKPYFIPSSDRPIPLSEEDKRRFACDVVFVGHYEPDGRREYLRGLVRAGLHVRLFGGGYWTREVLGDMADYFGEVRAVLGDDYVKALCGAKMCLCFLSKLNRDTYTRRCFEIPACGRLLLCERTKDLQEMFKEDEEAVFFSSLPELVEKATWLVNEPQELNRIAQAGMQRVYADGHDVNNRMRQMLEIITNV